MNSQGLAAQDFPVRVGGRVTRAFQEVTTLDTAFDAETGLGVFVVVDRLWRRVGVRLDYDRVADFNMQLFDTAPSSNTVSWLSGSVSVSAWCRLVCLAFEIGAGRGSYDLTVTESPGTDVPSVRIFDPGSSRAWRLGLSVRGEVLPHPEFFVTRYSMTVPMHRPGRVGRSTSMRSWILGVALSVP